MKNRLVLLLALILITATLEAKKIQFPNGDYYEGKCKKKQPHGQGTMFYVNGTIYEGNWVMGKRSGNGVFYSLDGIYTGRWENDIFIEGRWASEQTDQEFEGTFGHSFQIGTGKGKVVCEDELFDSDKYICEGYFEEGQIKIGKIHNQYTFIEGEWSSNCQLSNGVYMHFNNSEYVNCIIKKEKIFSGKIIRHIPYGYYEYYVENGKIMEAFGYIEWGEAKSKENNNREEQQSQSFNGVVTSELKYYRSYQADSGILPAGLNELEWRETVRKLTDNYPIDLGPVNENAEKLRQERMALKKQQQESDKQYPIDILSKSDFEANAITPKSNHPTKEHVYDFYINSDSIYFSGNNGDIFAWIYNPQNGENFSKDIDAFKKEIQEFENRKTEEKKKKLKEYYYANLSGYSFSVTMPLKDYISLAGVFYDVHAMMITITVKFNTLGDAILTKTAHIDTSKLNNYDRGYLIQQSMLAKEFSKKETYKYDVVGNHIIFGDYNFVFNSTKTSIVDTNKKLTLTKKDETFVPLL